VTGREEILGFARIAGVLLWIVLLGGGSTVADPIRTEGHPVVGKKLRFRYESGLEVEGHYRSYTEMGWRALTGPAKGSSGTETIHTAEVAANVFFISWLEKSGTSVSQVLDLNTSKVTAFVTFDTPQGRKSLFDKGTLTEIK
jgi:hypothetical protein